MQQMQDKQSIFPVKLPIEIVDKIFLMLDYETLQKTRHWQSDYIKKMTQFNNLEEATKNGSLNNMRWLIANGCPLSKQIFSYAVDAENIEIVEWLKENNCPFDQWEYKLALLYYHIELLYNKVIQ